MNRRFIVITATLMLLSCGRLPTHPAPTQSSSTAAGDATPPSPPAPVAPSVGPGGDGFSWRIVSVGDRWEVELTNNERTRPVFVACYEDPDRDIATQELHDATRGRVRGGEALTLSAETPCGRWQCDAVEGENVPKTAPFFGSNLILGRIGRRSCDSTPPPPTPEPEPCDGQELIVTAVIECGSLEVKSLDFEACTFECNEPE